MPTDVRATQAYAEATVSSEDADVRATQAYAEAVVSQEDADVRVTQVYVEVALENIPVAPPPPPTPEPSGTQPGLQWTAGGVNIVGIAEDLIIAEEDPGGFAEASFKIPARIDLDLDIKRWSDLVITDGDEVIYQGRIERIERQSDASGEWATYQAWGWQRHAVDDQKYRGILRDIRHDLDLFGYVGPESPPTAYKARITTDLGTDPGGGTSPAIKVFFPELESGETVTTGDAFDLRRLIPTTYPRSEAQRIRFSWRVLGGTAPANARLRVYSAPDPDDGTNRVLLYDQPWSIAASATEWSRTLDQTVDVLGSETGGIAHHWFIIRALYADGSITSFGASGRTVAIHSLRILGTGLDPGAGGIPLRGSAVVDEVIQAVCPAYDRSFITPSEAVIDAMVYTDTTAPADIFTETLLYGSSSPQDDPTWTWHVRERLANDLYRFTYEPHEQTLAYITYGIELNSPAQDSANEFDELVLTYEDEAGGPGEVVRTQRVQSLETLGVPRSRTIDVGKLKGSHPRTTQASAELIADAVLRQSRRPIRAGSFRIVGAQLIDAHSGGSVPFWRVRAGKLVFIGEASSAEPTKLLEDDPCVFRIRRIQKNLSEGYADVDIEQGTNLVEEQIARLSIRG